jgi:hypothetical protein
LFRYSRLAIWWSDAIRDVIADSQELTLDLKEPKYLACGIDFYYTPQLQRHLQFEPFYDLQIHMLVDPSHEHFAISAQAQQHEQPWAAAAPQNQTMRLAHLHRPRVI